jgi:hypothetical protein
VCSQDIPPFGLPFASPAAGPSGELRRGMGSQTLPDAVLKSVKTK